MVFKGQVNSMDFLIWDQNTFFSAEKLNSTVLEKKMVSENKISNTTFSTKQLGKIREPLEPETHPI